MARIAGPKKPPSKGAKKGAADAKAAAEKVADAPKQGVLRSIGDNGPKQKDFNHHWLTVLGYHTKMKEASGRYRSALKAADEAGIDTKSITAALTYKNKDKDAVRTYFAHLQKCFISAEIDVQVPLELSGGQVIDVGRPAEIFQQGFNLGTVGKSLKSSDYAPDSEQWNIFAQGWHAGQRSITKIGKTPAAAADGEGAESDGAVH